ncbi:biotin synthase [Betaproteobacteria bacterium]|nr:biotin synthase [Betaproteobacteria bacterium]GHU05289.1 biotin synthase [Betaproteobacteria bacterium]GHU24483.1 biotin synthase [Betaproteobacteria bacterium]
MLPADARWSVAAVEALFALPFLDLLFRAQRVHREHFTAGEVQRSTLLSIKTGGCSEDCGYCSQAARYSTGLERERLMPLDEVLEQARAARANGSSRFCMGAAWRSPKDKDLDAVIDMVREVKKLGLETCVTLGMLNDGQAEKLADAGLDYYNHNVDTAPDYYPEITTTHTLQDRLDTIDKVRAAGIHVCSGGIVGMGENQTTRAGLIAQLANMETPPESVPINNLVPIPGTPLADGATLDPFDFVRTIAVARITMPTSYVRLSAGREQMNDELQALCFMAGANSIFSGERLLTTHNADAGNDARLFERLDLVSI